MKKPLIIVESSSKCPKIISFLNNAYDCIASGGHICEISDGLKSIDLKDVLKTKFKTKSLPSLPTIFRHSKSENWLQLCNEVDNKSSAIAMDKIVEKKAVQLEEITDKLKQKEL